MSRQNLILVGVPAEERGFLDMLLLSDCVQVMLQEVLNKSQRRLNGLFPSFVELVFQM